MQAMWLVGLYAFACVVSSSRHASSIPISTDTRRWIVEGDMVMSDNLARLIATSSANGRQRKRYAIKDTTYHWSDGVIPYHMSTRLDHVGVYYIGQAIEEVQNRTCIRFVRRTTEQDYVEFIPGDGCYSSVGKQGGKQEISLGDGCKSKGQALHEIMHTLGLFHEQSRIDRDFYVKILWWNIVPGSEKNFATYSHGIVDTFGAPYDMRSIMHYGNTAFSKNGENTIEAIENPTERLGRDDLSGHDVSQIRQLYKCSAKAHGGNCEDKSKKCAIARQHEKYCIAYKETLKELCPKTCGFC